jgi:hypothetical protein
VSSWKKVCYHHAATSEFLVSVATSPDGSVAMASLRRNLPFPFCLINRRGGRAGSQNAPLPPRRIRAKGDTPTKNSLPVRLDFEVQGVGLWQRELSIYLPTAEQMAERAKMIASMPWLWDAF